MELWYGCKFELVINSWVVVCRFNDVSGIKQSLLEEAREPTKGLQLCILYNTKPSGEGKRIYQVLQLYLFLQVQWCGKGSLQGLQSCIFCGLSNCGKFAHSSSSRGMGQAVNGWVIILCHV